MAAELGFVTQLRLFVEAAHKELENYVLKAQRTVNQTDPFKIVAAGPASAEDTLDGCSLHDDLLYLDLHTSLSWRRLQPPSQPFASSLAIVPMT